MCDPLLYGCIAGYHMNQVTVVNIRWLLPAGNDVNQPQPTHLVGHGNTFFIL